MDHTEIDLRSMLKKHFGFDEFKGLQEGVIKSIIGKKNTFDKSFAIFIPQYMFHVK